MGKKHEHKGKYMQPSSTLFISVPSLSHVQLFATPWTAAHQASLSITNSKSLLKLMSIESVMPSYHLILSSPSPPAVNLSLHQEMMLSNESAFRIRWPKYWSFSFSNSPSNEHPGLISFRIDQLDLPAIQGTLKSFLQHHNFEASILQCSAFFMVQLSHLYMTTGKTIALTIWNFVGKLIMYQFSSVQFTRSVMSDSLRPHESEHARPPCPSPTPGVHSDSRPLSP